MLLLLLAAPNSHPRPTLLRMMARLLRPPSLPRVNGRGAVLATTWPRMNASANAGQGGGLPFRSCFRSSSAAVPQQLRSSSAAAPQQLRSSSAAAPQQLRSSSAAAPQQLRSSSAAAPQQLRSSSAVVPCYLRSRSVLPPQSFRVTYLRSSTDETPASPPSSVGYAHGGRLWAEVRPPPRQRSRARVSRREPRDGRVRWRGE